MQKIDGFNLEFNILIGWVSIKKKTDKLLNVYLEKWKARITRFFEI